MYDAQYSSSLFVRRCEIHVTVPIDFPPSHCCCLLFSFFSVSAVTNTSKDNASLPPSRPRSMLFDNRALSFPKNKDTFHLPGDHGEGNGLFCCADDDDDDDGCIDIDIDAG